MTKQEDQPTSNADGHITPIEASLKILHKCKVIKHRNRNTH